MAGRLRLAQRIAEETGQSVADAHRFVRNVGPDKARLAVRAAEDGVTWKLPATVIAGSGAALTWRQQDVRKAEAIAEEAGASADETGDAAEALQLLLEEGDELPPGLQEELMEGFNPGDDGSSDDEDDDPTGLRALVESLGGEGGLGGLTGSVTTTLILLVVVLVVLNYVLAETGSGGGLSRPSIPSPYTGGGVA